MDCWRYDVNVCGTEISGIVYTCINMYKLFGVIFG